MGSGVILSVLEKHSSALSELKTLAIKPSARQYTDRYSGSLFIKWENFY
jgi:hypothetical protein